MGCSVTGGGTGFAKRLSTHKPQCRSPQLLHCGANIALAFRPRATLPLRSRHRSLSYTRPTSLIGFRDALYRFVTIEGFVTGFVTSSTPKSHPPQCLSPHNRQRGASIPSPKTGRGAPTTSRTGAPFHGGEGGPNRAIFLALLLAGGYGRLCKERLLPAQSHSVISTS